MRIGVVVLAVMSLFLQGCGDGTKSGQMKTAPDFTLPFFRDQAQEFTLSEQAARTPVLLVFWATWCPPCVEEVPLLKRIQETYSPEQLKLAAVNVGQAREALEEFQRQHDLNYDVLMDEAGDVAALYGVAGLPVAVLLAKGGEILYYGFTLPRLEEYLPPSP